jgi:8-oxo-dGTP pyrophosphatase MutT (NUDIX family)
LKGLKPDCFRCTHWIGIGSRGWACDAFDTIPIEILSRRRKHVEAYEGDGGVRFEAKKSQTEAKYCAVSTDDERCRGCKSYVVENGCRVVDGPISPFGWCPGYAAASAGLMLEDGRIRNDSVVEREAGVLTGDDVPLPPNSERTVMDGELLPASGVMVVTAGGKVLLLRRVDSGQWAFPAGKIEDGESADEAAIRECEEETGFKPEVGGEWTRRQADGVDFTTYMSIVPEEFDPVLNEEHDAFQWVPVDDLANSAMRELGLT